jgi:hypothetical protein
MMRVRPRLGCGAKERRRRYYRKIGLHLTFSIYLYVK